MDLSMPRLDGIEATREILISWPETHVLVLTSFAGDDQVLPAIRAGAAGYLLKDSDSQELVQAIREVYRGESTLDSKVAPIVLREMRSPSHIHPGEREATAQPAELEEPSAAPVPLTAQQAAKLRYGGLTGREREVAVLIAQGKSNAAIASELVLTVRTVEAHVTRILDKLGFSSRTQVVAWAIGRGLASPPESLDEQMRGDTSLGSE